MSCPIIQLNVQPYQRQNDAIWYPIQIKLYNHSYELKYRFSEFVQFSRAIQERFNFEYLEPINPTIKSRFLSIIKKNTTENNNQKYIDRQLQLEKFCAQLVLLPCHITCSHLFLAFFSATKQQHQHQQSLMTKSTIKRVLCSTKSKKHNLIQISSSNRLSRHSTTTTFSTSNSDSSSSSSSATLSSSSSNSNIQDLKLKIIFDCDNIIIIRVTRSVSLDQLRSQVIQKFALLRIPLPDQLSFFDLLLAGSAPFHDGSDNGVISDEYQFKAVMQQKWACLEKVTLQCII
jgi:hypothetical protein